MGGCRRIKREKERERKMEGRREGGREVATRFLTLESLCFLCIPHASLAPPCHSEARSIFAVSFKVTSALGLYAGRSRGPRAEQAEAMDPWDGKRHRGGVAGRQRAASEQEAVARWQHQRQHQRAAMRWRPGESCHGWQPRGESARVLTTLDACDREALP